jgi:hypothetical protein
MNCKISNIVELNYSERWQGEEMKRKNVLGEIELKRNREL